MTKGLMRRAVRTGLVAVIAYAAQAALAGGWQVTTSTDSLTDAVLRAATITLDDGHTLGVHRSARSGQVWATLMIPIRRGAVLRNYGPLFRVDKLAPHLAEDFPPVVGYKGRLVGMRSASWIIWHGRGYPEAGILYEWLNGAELRIRYYLWPEGTEDVSFSLVGAKPAILEAVGLTPAK